MVRVVRPDSVAIPVQLAIVFAVSFGPACAGPDHLTEMVIAQGGSYFASYAAVTTGPATGGATTSQTGGTNATGGSGLGGTTNGNSGGDNSSVGGAVTFNWGTSSYAVTGGNNVAYQGHYTGMACLASCHGHSFTAAGTVYQANGTTPAANAQIGVLLNGTFSTTYSGSQGNFYMTIGGNANWSNAQMAIRTATGTLTMPVNPNANGNCNSCHTSTNRIIVP